MYLLDSCLAGILAQECTRLHQNHLWHLKTMTVSRPLPGDSDSDGLRWVRKKIGVLISFVGISDLHRFENPQTRCFWVFFQC